MSKAMAFIAVNWDKIRTLPSNERWRAVRVLDTREGVALPDFMKEGDYHLYAFTTIKERDKLYRTIYEHDYEGEFIKELHKENKQ